MMGSRQDDGSGLRGCGRLSSDVCCLQERIGPLQGCNWWYRHTQEACRCSAAGDDEGDAR
jgi:hypothetical protein